ncbi:hypothetical protein C2G38_2184773 [Gigaspora rosea]|uniref:Protein kinase domain-containing protein n=1 Tax=Gigaspora rosea TaxID=44941 RepID=A0A397VEL0_9GLOM|nr:hypothetical protein C2G38_2184773 [Gigaspora rosea]
MDNFGPECLIKTRRKMKFCNWTSDNQDVDQLIQQTQLNALKFKDIIEWIPFSKFTNIKYLAKGGFDGYIALLDNNKNKWLREGKVDVCLKGNSAIAIYGLTKNPKDGNYMIVMEYAKQEILRKLLNSKYVNQNMFTSYITDFGLCKPVSQDSTSKALFGVLPYIAPENLTGYPPYHDISHDSELAIQICYGSDE